MIGPAHEARALSVGYSLGAETHAAITRVEIAWYMVASYDLNPIHIDEPFAQEAGFPSVIGQGMIPLGWLSARLVKCTGLHRLRNLKSDFKRPLFPGDILVTDLCVQEVRETGNGVEILWQMTAKSHDGTPKLQGTATTFHEE